MPEVKSESQVKLISWPSPQDYNEAIQNLAANTQDAQLQTGHVHLTQLGLPRPLTGAFASVYRVDCPTDSIFAVRCFLRDMSDQEARYQHISQFVQNDTLPYTVTFDFLRSGIRVGPNWFPALKMDWVSGPNLDQYISQHVNSPHMLEKLADAFEQMCKELREAGIAHGDLQHGNIIMSNGELRLVDYDGMYVPAMKGMLSNEIGHRNYQHPSRTANDFGPQLDNFSAWVIYTSIRALVLDPHLWKQLGGGDECLLFRRDDFAQPEFSYAFHRLENHHTEEVRAMAKRLRWLAHQSISDIPYLDPKLHVDTSALPELVEWNVAPKAKHVESMATAIDLPYDLIDPENDDTAEQPIPRLNPALMQQYEQNRILAIEPELNQPRPRWSLPCTKWALDRTLCDQELVENGRITRTTSFEIKKERQLQDPTVDQYVAHYSYLVDGKEFHRQCVLSEEEVFKHAAMREATILYRPNEPGFHVLYFRAGYKAALVKVPIGIEPELRKRTRAVARADIETETEISPLGATLIIAALLVCLISAANHSNPGVTISALMGVLGLILCIATPNRQEQMAKTGVPVQARVLDVTPGVPDSPWGTQPSQVTIRYRYQSYDHQIITRTIKTSHPGFLQMKMGTKFTVLYDIAKPENHVIYQLSQFKAL